MISVEKSSMMYLLFEDMMPDFFQPRFLALFNKSWASWRVWAAMWMAAGSQRR